MSIFASTICTQMWFSFHLYQHKILTFGNPYVRAMHSHAIRSSTHSLVHSAAFVHENLASQEEISEFELVLLSLILPPIVQNPNILLTALVLFVMSRPRILAAAVAVSQSSELRQSGATWTYFEPELRTSLRKGRA